MKPRVLDWLVCPVCGHDLWLSDVSARRPTPTAEAFPPSSCTRCHAPTEARRRTSATGTCDDCYGIEVESGLLSCQRGHAFPVTGGVPRLSLDAQLKDGGPTGASSGPARAIRASFSREWGHFSYDDRTWGQDVEERCQLFLREVELPADALRGTVVLDAGCGNGSLSRGINAFGCEVLAADVSDSVEVAYRHFAGLGNDRTHFVQADLMHPPFRPGAFDVVYSSGVLHHTPDTRATLNAIVPALAPGGTVYVWLYGKMPGLRWKMKQTVRRALAPLPGGVKHGVMWVWLGQSLARIRLRRALGRARPDDSLNWRELMIMLFDTYTPRYRWEHTPEELEGWYRDLGLIDIRKTEERFWGFGCAARRPLMAAAGAGQSPGSP